MYLSKIKINHFRKIQNLEVCFSDDVNIIVGENNSGKTAIIDALRILLVHGSENLRYSINEDDFTDGFSPKKPILISGVFKGISMDEEVKLYEALVYKDNGFEAHIHASFEIIEKGSRIRSKWWCGEKEGGNIPFDVFEHLSCIYLPPLRDPEKGLRPGRRSQLSRLVKHISSDDDKDDFVGVADKSNLEMLKLQPVKTAKTTVNDGMQSITGPELLQKTDLVFVDPNFERLISSLRPLVEGHSIEQNGLGYNNLIYTAITMGTLQKDKELAFRGILIEEPEAHLHPQLQTLLLKYLKETSGKGKAPVQVIMTTHSPTFASQASVDKLISLNEVSGDLRSVQIQSLKLTEPITRKLERYLDATKAEIFFARKIIFVEGLSEAILLPVLASKMDNALNLREKAVSIIITAGVNFDIFIPLFAENGIHIPVAILTDSDPSKNPYPAPDDVLELSSTAEKLKKAETDNLKVSLSKKTLEYDLALEESNLPIMLEAYSTLHPTLANKLKANINPIACRRTKAELFYQFLFETKNRKTSKPEYAEALAVAIKNQKTKFKIPKYIMDVLNYFST